MAPEPAGPSRPEIEQKLKDLRDNPVDSRGMKDADILPLHRFLLDAKSKEHWFCSKADPLAREAALFLNRLFAYKNEKVTEWKEHLVKVLSNCTDCVGALDRAKEEINLTYFAAFSKDVMRSFWSAFDEFEAQSSAEALANANLADAQFSIVYLMLSKLASFKNPAVLNVLPTLATRKDMDKWPLDPPPAGIFLLALHNDDTIRGWARAILVKATVSSRENFTINHELVLKVIMDRLSPGDQKDSTKLVKELSATFPFSSSLEDVWFLFSVAIRVAPPEVIESFKVHRLVIAHLHDDGPQFSEVLRCLVQCLKRLGSKMWEGESPEYPQVVFDSIKDNPSYSGMLLTSDPTQAKPWFLLFMLEFLGQLWGSPIFGEVLAKFAAFVCDELQHERFGNNRSVAITALAQVLSAALQKAAKSKTSTQKQSIRDVLRIHADLFVAVGFSAEYNKPQWSEARKHVLTMLRTVMTADLENIASAVHRAQEVVVTISVDKIKALVPVIQTDLWQKVYKNLQGQDQEGLAFVIGLVAKSVYPDMLRRHVVMKRIIKHFDAAKEKPTLDRIKAADALVESVQSALNETREGLNDAITRFANMNQSSSLLKLLQRGGVIRNLFFLMLSPVDDLHIGAQTLIGQAFDVDGRSDCFRELFKHDLEASFLALQDYLSKFNDYALKAVEACDLSKALVRCFTDILDVLVSSPDALLKDEELVKRYSKEGSSFTLKDELPKLWKRMTIAVAVIFKGTPRWAVYAEKDSMVEWMRDALIFARELLAQRKQFETAAIIASGNIVMFEGEQKLSDIGKALVDDLQGVLLELTGWLRLTDFELLYQSFALLKSLFECLKEADTKPSPEVITKLQKFMEAKRQDGNKITMLTSSDVLELEVALANFEEAESDIEILSTSLKGKKAESERSSSPDILEISEVKRKILEKAPAARSEGKPAKQSKLSFDSAPTPSSSKTRLEPVKSTRPVESSRVKRDAKTGIKFEGRKPSARSVSSRSSAQEESSSSSSESDSADEKGRRGLARLVAIQPFSPQKPKIRARIPKYKERRQVKMIDDPMMEAYNLAAERMRKAEEARRIQMRLKPDITPLHRTILSWDYDHSGELPPFQDGNKPQLIPVPERFKDHKEYLRVFEPLLLYECWAQITKSKEESTAEVYSCRIAGRTHVDYWLDLEMTTVDPVKAGWRLTPETDVVLLRNPENRKCIMAKVTNFRPVMTGIQISVRCCTMGHLKDPGLGMNAVWKLSVVFSLTTLHREYGALMALPYYEMADIIYRPKLSNLMTFGAKEVQETMTAYQLNEPQSKAILSSLKTTGFSLIQGPPGTGKTSTICGLVGAFLSSRRRVPTAITAGSNGTAASASQFGKILICAPSNAAIDEVARRINDGVFNSQGKRFNPKVVRVGADASINVSTRDISLDALVDKMLDESGEKDANETNAVMASARIEIEEIRKTRQRKQEELNKVGTDVARIHALEEEIKALNAQRIALSQRLDRLRDQQKSNVRAVDAARRKLRYEVLAGADIICSTLSGSGHEQLETFDFDFVIIDEAAQAIELSTLIPLKYRSTRCIMVGDPQQLPPTVLSQEATKWGYNQSLFVRLQKHNPAAVHLLSIQYRMHPQISQLPSKVFYSGKLQDGPGMDKKTAQPWHSDPRLGAYKFFSVMRGREEASRIGHSLYNREECRVILTIYNRLRNQIPPVNLDYRVGIVSMYRAQVAELRKLFTARYGADILGKIDFSTVDGFQGQEKDIIILSCVRAGPSLSTVGFLADVRRMNVAITRARSSLFIVGHGPTLERSNETWRNIVADARDRSCYVELDDTSYFTESASQTNSNDIKHVKPKAASKKKKKAVSNASSVVTNPASPEQLLTPKEMKSLPQVKSSKVATLLSPATTSRASGSASSQKRAHDEEKDNHVVKKPKLADRIQSPTIAAESSSVPKRPIDKDPPPRPAPPNRINSEASKQSTQMELKRFQKRRNKQANSLFIKR